MSLLAAFTPGTQPSSFGKLSKMTRIPFYSQLRPLILPSEAINQALPQVGKIIDLGCGQGLLAKYLASVPTRNVVGVDLDQKRMRQTKRKNLSFIRADIRTFNLAGANGAVLSDVLHHLSKNDQQLLLKNIAKTLKKDGVLVLKEIDTKEFIRSKLSRLWDFVLYPQDKIYFSSAVHFRKTLEGLGFYVEITRPSRLFPGSTTLFICTKQT